MASLTSGTGLIFLAAACAVLFGACAEGRSTIVIQDNGTDRVTVIDDPAAGQGHSHPYQISTEDMASVLKGVMVKDRNAILGFGVFKDRQGAQAFPNTVVTRLAPHLSKALSRASPHDLVTFYVTKSDEGKGPLVTSGGLFVRNGRMYFMLANVRTRPRETSNDFSFAMELDNRDAPLEPIGRFRFTVGFVPSEAWIPYDEAKRQSGYEPFVDESKLAVIDLGRLREESARPPEREQPAETDPIRPPDR